MYNKHNGAITLIRGQHNFKRFYSEKMYQQRVPTPVVRRIYFELDYSVNLKNMAQN